jgi:hypothetical protein
MLHRARNGCARASRAVASDSVAGYSSAAVPSGLIGAPRTRGRWACVAGRGLRVPSRDACPPTSGSSMPSDAPLLEPGQEPATHRTIALDVPNNLAAIRPACPASRYAGRPGGVCVIAAGIA